MDAELILTVLELVNETLTATIVIVAVSILLYNLTQYTRDRVTRASAIVLLCVMLAYLADVVISLEPGEEFLAFWLRFQWIGIAFVPAALFHLSDALLATTGRPSRGRRKRVVYFSYVLSLAFTLTAAFSDALIKGPHTNGIVRMKPGPVFAVYVAYLLVIAITSMINVVRARRRCLTRYTRRRMTYLLVVFLTPAYGIFPYSLLFGGVSDNSKAPLLVVLNLANLIVMLMLVFMAYPLSFFGSEKPDRVVKSQLLEFILRGPLTGAVVMAVVLFLPGTSNVLGLDGETLLPFAAVTTVLVMQWSITRFLPVIERWLIYTQEQQQAEWLQGLGERLLTEADAAQLLESMLAALCDHLRVPTAFVAKIERNEVQLVQAIGSMIPSPEALTAPELSALTSDNADDHKQLNQVDGFFLWNSYWLVPLRSKHAASNGALPPLLGILGVWGRAPEPNLDDDETMVYESMVRQITQVLEDLQRQSQIFIVLEGLASQMDVMQQLRGVSRYGQVAALPAPAADLTSDPQFTEMVKDALRDYWGGPKLTESELLHLNVVWHEMEDGDNNTPVRALRNVLARAIENLKPEGERSLTTAEWILYNILEMRFLQGRKVRDVALRLAMSESDLYRKQRIAIEEVARQIEDMERDLLANHDTAPGSR
ncbi:MAG: hypothetical protein GYB65_18275 [Chloroflexi bacterium]|nr:hypothetical protein [Chloroflexota bacterium]